MSDLARVCWDVLRLRPPVMAWSLRTHETVFTASVELSGAEFSTDCSSVQGGCHSHQTGTRPGRAGGEAGQYVTKLLQPPAATNMKSKFEQVVQPVRPHNSACCTVPKQREATAVSHTHTPSTGPRGVTNMFQPTHSTTFSPHTSIPRISSDVRQSSPAPSHLTVLTDHWWSTLKIANSRNWNEIYSRFHWERKRFPFSPRRRERKSLQARYIGLSLPSVSWECTEDILCHDLLQVLLSSSTAQALDYHVKSHNDQHEWNAKSPSIFVSTPE